MTHVVADRSSTGRGDDNVAAVAGGVAVARFPGRCRGRLAAAFALGSAAHALTATTGFAAPVTPWHAVLIAISTANAVVFWLFARALFDDAFALRRWHIVPWAVVAASSLVNCLVLAPAHVLDPRIPAIAMTVVSLAFVALAVGQTIASWSADNVSAAAHRT